MTTNLTSPGGILEFQPTISFRDSTVYYWRVAEVAAGGIQNWSGSSFIYMQGTDSGFNQSHYYQHLKSTYSRMRLDSGTRTFQYEPVQHELYIRNGVWGTATGQEGDLVVNVDGLSFIRNTCYYGLIFNVFDSKSFRPWVNTTAGLYGSKPWCGSARRQYNFEFDNDSVGRRKALAFLRQIPNDNIIVVRNQPYNTQAGNEYAADWLADANRYGAANTLYFELKQAGFTLIDSINRPRVFAFVYKKNNGRFIPQQGLSLDKFDVLTLSAYPFAADSTGTKTSPQFGPAAAWKRLQWSGNSLEASGADTVQIDLIGIKIDGTVDTLLRNNGLGIQDVDISHISAATYPYLKMQMRSSDRVNFTPWQLRSWRLFYTPKAEGAVAPNMLFQMKDTFDVGEPITLKMAFKNISDVAFDSILVKAVVTDQSNVARPISLGRYKPLRAGDTITVNVPIDSRRLVGANTLYVDVNP
ncbi:MAG: hypothetical protein EOP50_13765, partial [Sphingobacteriales bacterium]